MDEPFMAQLVFLRKTWGKPLPLNSAFRCPRHNTRVSKTGPEGPHTTGKAVDIRIYGGEAHALMKLVMKEFDYTGIGWNQKGPYAGRFIHLDTLVMPGREWIWTY